MASEQQRTIKRNNKGNSGPSSKKVKLAEDLPFTEKGGCDDEVILRFDDGTELYVSKGFLTYMSPVFKSMFGSDFQEKRTGTVNMLGKEYASVLDFLLACHPRKHFDFTVEKAMQIVPLAEEYMVDKLTKTINSFLVAELKQILSKHLNPPSFVLSFGNERGSSDRCLTCQPKSYLSIAVVPSVLTIVKAVQLHPVSYDDVLCEAGKVLQHCNSNYFKWSDGMKLYANKYVTETIDSEEIIGLLKTCTNLYRSLRPEAQVKILEARLNMKEERLVYSP